MVGLVFQPTLWGLTVSSEMIVSATTEIASDRIAGVILFIFAFVWFLLNFKDYL